MNDSGSKTRPSTSATAFDVAIIGAGPAGLAAAAAATAAGARAVVIDAGEQPGGQFWRHRSEAADAQEDGALHHGWRTYLELRGAMDASIADGSLDYLPSTGVWMARRLNSGFALHLTPTGVGSSAREVRAAALVFATGGYDRQLPVPGWELPGVMAAGGIQAFVKQNGILPGRRFVLAGTGPFLLPVAANIVQAGGAVAGVFEATRLSKWLPHLGRAAAVPSKALEGAAYAWTFARNRIRYRSRTIITEIIGEHRVEGVRIANASRDGAPVPGSERVIEKVDAVGLGWGFTPQLELPVSLGVDTRIDADGSLVATVDDLQRSSVSGVLLAGELTGVGGSVLAVHEGRVAGRAAAAEALGHTAHRTAAETRAIARQRAFARAMHIAHPVPDRWHAGLTDDTIVCRCEEVTVGAVRSAHSTLAADDSRTQKSVTRAGMGWCQGRVCGFAVSCLSSGPPHESLLQSSRRPIAQPLPLSDLIELEG